MEKYRIECEKCKNVIDCQVDFEVSGCDDDRPMGPETFYTGYAERKCNCGNHIEITVEASEYPEGAGIEIFSSEIKGGKII